MNLGPQMADISVNNQMANFNTGPYAPPPLEIKILEIVFLHAIEDQEFFMNLGPQMAKIRVDNQRANFNTFFWIFGSRGYSKWIFRGNGDTFWGF